MSKLRAFCFAIMASVAWNGPVNADTIRRIYGTDLPNHLETFVIGDGGVGPFSVTHTLDNIHTNWQSTSTIIETPGIADSVTVSWGIRHWIGPHADDINPQPTITTLSVTFIDPGTGPNSIAEVKDTKIVEHLTTTGEIHYDIFTLSFFSIKFRDEPTVNRHISSYGVTYDAVHSTVPVPEPASLALFGIGLASMLAWRRRMPHAI